MNRHYNRNYTWEQIAMVLATIQDCIRENRFIISKNENRRENVDFINEYNLSNRRQKEILQKINPEDFCHSLFNFDGIEELVDIYTKFNLIDSDSGKRVVVISFHKRNKAINYLFR
ncbi:MAG TPA: hypothetical protein DEB05_04360 [Firmicutes bacterium]|jgi:predicted ATP-dependent Lon-type protease|nr:hypothetical protein [Bacillota bacterium]